MRYDRTAIGQVYQLAPAVFIDDGKAATKVLDAAFKVADAWDIKSHVSVPRPSGRNVDGQAVDTGNESVHLVNDPVHTAAKVSLMLSQILEAVSLIPFMAPSQAELIQFIPASTRPIQPV